MGEVHGVDTTFKTPQPDLIPIFVPFRYIDCP